LEKIGFGKKFIVLLAGVLGLVIGVVSAFFSELILRVHRELVERAAAV
jgi:uncharacterized protein involved in exopolysaccharide biosynthesis